MNHLFGTDGIRGAYGKDMTPRLCFSIGRAVAALQPSPTVVVGRDPRKSGDTLTHALLSGLTAGGAKALFAGVIPTPALSFLIAESGSDFGVMITASHNEEGDNGIKLFGKTGRKFTRCGELRIEALLAALKKDDTSIPYACGKVGRLSARKYRERLESMPTLSGLTVALDLSRGSACGFAARAFTRLGAKVCVTGRRDRLGRLGINQGCGATTPSHLSAFTQKTGADIGFAFDGDGDRVLLCDRDGKTYDGDELLYLLSVWRGAEEVVGTVSTNGGIEAALRQRKIGFSRAAVGDRNVTALMEERGATIGAEASGHVVFFPEMITGDSILAALYMAGLYRELREDFFCRGAYTLRPQVSLSVLTSKSELLSLPLVKDAVCRAHALLGKDGRLLVRPSGTERKIRILAESEDRALAQRAATEVQTALCAAQNNQTIQKNQAAQNNQAEQNTKILPNNRAAQNLPTDQKQAERSCFFFSPNTQPPNSKGRRK